MIDVREIRLDLHYPDSRQEDIADAFARGYAGAVEIGNKAIEKLERENARLRERYEEYEQKMDGLVDVLTGGLLSKSAGTPNEFIEDAASEHLTKDLAEENAKLVVKLNAEHLVHQNAECENARLRELASVLWYCMQDRKDCDGCRLNGAEGELSYDPLCACDGLHEMMRELGVGVDG